MPAKQKRKQKQQQPTEQLTEYDDPPLFFYLPGEKHGELCQWYPSPFRVRRASLFWLQPSPPTSAPIPNVGDPDETIDFNCAEQFMMFCKALHFADAASQARILASIDPMQQKWLGRAVPGFDDRRWAVVRERVVEQGNWHKFAQSEALRAKLLATGERTLCEASSHDRVWGIGFKADRAVGRERYWGANLLGKALMRVRERLREVEHSGRQGCGGGQ